MKKAILDQYRKYEDNFSDQILVANLKQIADTLAPSQSIRYTRGPVVAEIVRKAGLENVVFDLDYMGTGNCVLHAKGGMPNILFIAHLDQISYLIDSETADGIWRLIPFCKHLSQREVRAVALRFDLWEDQYQRAATGVIYPQKEGRELVPYFRLEEGSLQSGDRIVYESPLVVKQDLLNGNLDNAAGVAACLLAGLPLFEAFPETKVGFVFSDEEEGATDSLLYFGRGVRRLMHKIDTPEMCFIIDGHGGRDGEDIGRGTFFTEKTGGGLATITPPNVFLKIKQIAGQVKDLGINLFEDEGRVSRSDDIPCLSVTPNVCSVGFPSVNRHHDFGPPTVSTFDLVNLAKVIFWLGASFDREVS